MKPTRRHLLAAAAVLSQAGAQSKTPVVDAHCHAGTGEAMSAPWTTRASVEETLRHMEQAGIDRTVIFPINSQSFERANREIASIVEKHPAKFIGFAKHDPQTEAGKVPAMLRREIREMGLKGLKLHRLPSRDILETVAELGIPILYHPEKVANYHMIAAEFPQVPMIMAHLGNFASRDWNEHLQAIAVARRYPNVYLETSSVVFWKYLEMAAKELGADKLIFGSDGPEVDSRVELYKIRLLKFPPAEEAKVTGGNILRLLRMA